jgi:hypothetical protein
MPTYLFLHTWVQSTKKAAGINLRQFVIQVLRELQIPFTPYCLEDADCWQAPEFHPKGLKSAADALSDEKVKEGFALLLQANADLNAKYEALRAELDALKPATPALGEGTVLL